jgi:hypothetical protein
MLKFHGWIGLAIIGLSEILLYFGQPFVKTYFTPLVWTGYILFADSLVFRQKGRSLIVNHPQAFLFLVPLSITLWLVFEYYNLFIRNWRYTGLPEDILPRWLGYAWAFATIWPAILLTAEALEGWGFLKRQKIHPVGIRPLHLKISFLFGIGCLISPFVVPSQIAEYLAAPVWLGFIFFLDPVNAWLGGRSLFRDLQKGNPKRLYSLLLSGFICGWLWEFWNYWAEARWHYAVPILGHIKIFEMPILGYLGFPPFAVECSVMYVFFKTVLGFSKESYGSDFWA